jgi:hypothetical protein
VTQIFSLIFFIVLTTTSLGQTKEDSSNLKFPDNAKLSEKFRKAIKEQTAEFNRLCYKDSAVTKKYTVQFMLDKIDSDSNYDYVFLAEYWIVFHYKDMIPQLIKRITNKKEVGLINTADLIIWERIESGHLEFYGHGGVSDDDLFTVAGRANLLLKDITGENFGNVGIKSSREFLIKLQSKWVKWIKALEN